MAEMWPALLGSLRNYRLLIFAGLVKNAGKTTAFNAVNRLFAQEALGITSFGYDGEDRDAIYDYPKPPVQAYSGQILLTAERFLSERQGREERSTGTGEAFEVLERWGNHPQFGPWLIVRCRRDVLVRLAGPSNLPELAEGIKKLVASGAARIHLDGALGRLSHLSLAPAGVILSTGAALGNSLEEVVERTRRVLEYFLLPVEDEGGQMPGDGLNVKVSGGPWSVQTRAGSVRMMSGDNAYKLEDIWYVLPKFLWTKKLQQLLPQGYEKLYLGGALTDRLYHELRAVRRLPKTFLLDYPGQILLSAPVWQGLKLRGISVSLRRRSDLVCLTLSPWHPQRPIPTPELAAALRPYSYVPLVDVERERIWG